MAADGEVQSSTCQLGQTWPENVEGVIPLEGIHPSVKSDLAWVRAAVNLLFGLAVPLSFWLVATVDKFTPTTVSIAAPPLLVGIAWLMRKWLWIPFRFLVGGKPWLQGTYRVILKSDYPGPSRHQDKQAIEAYASVSQDAWGESVTLATRTTTSHALHAFLRPSGDHHQLFYSYSTTPPQQDVDENSAQLGTATLDILRGGKGKMRGRYFTDRRTRGDMIWERIGRRPYSDFDHASDYAKRKGKLG